MNCLSGTYSVSKIVTAKKATACAKCTTPIQKGQEYLRYAPGQRRRTPYCMDCALEVGPYGPKLDCHDVRKRLGIEQRRI